VKYILFHPIQALFEHDENIDFESMTFQAKIQETMENLPPMKEEELAIIERETRGQSSNEKWFYHRRGRLHSE
jgi:hypothetical protein